MDDLQAQLMVQMLPEEEQEVEEDEDEVQEAVATGILVYGVWRNQVAFAQKDAHLSGPTWHNQSFFPTHKSIPPPWQSLYASQSDQAFIAMMGFNVQTFHDILNKGFETEWNTQPIPRWDVLQTSASRPSCRSLDASGALGLALHFLTSIMTEISLMQIFALIPSTVSRFINFSLTILLKTLRKMPDARISVTMAQPRFFQKIDTVLQIKLPVFWEYSGVWKGPKAEEHVLALRNWIICSWVIQMALIWLSEYCQFYLEHSVYFLKKPRLSHGNTKWSE